MATKKFSARMQNFSIFFEGKPQKKPPSQHPVLEKAAQKNKDTKKLRGNML